MQENFIHFLSTDKCQISINGSNIGIIDNVNTFELDILTKAERLFVSYNPISQKTNYLSNTFEIINNNILNSNNNYIKVVPFPNNHYDIIMKPFYYYQIDSTEVILNQQIGKYFVSIVTDNVSRINIFSGASLVFSINIPKIKTAKASIEKDLLTIKGVIDNDTYYLLVVDTTNFKIIHNDISHSIEISDKYIQSLKNLKDISHHSIVYKIDKEKKSLECYRVYENNTLKLPHSNFLIPHVFLEAIQQNDEKLAIDCLCLDLNNTTIQKLKNYFGDIESIHLNRHEIIANKLNYTIFANNKYKNYTFIIENNKIKDIEEIF